MRRLIKLQRSLYDITLAINIFSFASSLVGVFIPLVILKSGGHLWEVPAFYLLYSVIKAMISYPSVLLVRTKGAQVGLGGAFIFGALHMLSILAYVSTRNAVLLPVGAAALSFTNALLWNSQHVFMSKVIDEGTKSSNMATFSILGQLSGIVAPLVGGLVGAYLGSASLMILAMLLCLLAFLPLFGMGRHIDMGPIANEKVKYDFSGAPKRDIIANYSFNVETAISIMVWPIYLAVVVASYQDIGAIMAIASVVAIFVTWIAGHRGDRGQDRSVLREGIAITSMIDIVRIVGSTHLLTAAITSGYKASLSYFANAWASIYYHHAKHRGIQYIMSMEIANDLAYISAWGALLIVLVATSSTRLFFVSAFVIAASSAWGCLLITDPAKRRLRTFKYGLHSPPS